MSTPLTLMSSISTWNSRMVTFDELSDVTKRFVEEDVKGGGQVHRCQRLSDLRDMNDRRVEDDVVREEGTQGLRHFWFEPVRARR